MPTKTTVTKLFHFAAGHRLLGHGEKCRHLHGHGYVAEVEVGTVTGLDQLGMVADFGMLKDRIGKWIDANWDHNLLLNVEDPQLLHLQRTEERLPYVMPNGNPTAENMAEVLQAVAQELLESAGLVVVRVRIWETEACFAEAKR